MEPQHDVQGGAHDDANAPSTVVKRPLAEQIMLCQQQWFAEAIETAADEVDPVQMGLVGLMLQQGWGCTRNTKEAAKWLAEAARRGAEMPSGYKVPDDLPPPIQLAHLPPPGTPTQRKQPCSDSD